MDGEINLVNLKPFNMRQVTLSNFPVNEKRSVYKSHSTILNKYREEYLLSSPKNSLSALRHLLQDKINKDINLLLENYSKLYFKPAIDNIRKNAKSDDLIELDEKQIFHEILDEAKKMYMENKKSSMKKCNENIGDDFLTGQYQRSRGRPSKYKIVQKNSSKSKVNPALKQTKLSLKKKHKKELMSVEKLSSKSKSSEVVCNDQKWNPSRLTTETLFVLGSKANKALGFGASRGRLYSKHADLFRYIGDQEDKEWLHRNQLMPATGGKAYLLLKQDIVDLINSKEYADTPGVNAADMGRGFTVPQSMIHKMTSVMKNMKKTFYSQNKYESKCQLNLNDNTLNECNPPKLQQNSLNIPSNGISELLIFDSDFSI